MIEATARRMRGAVTAAAIMVALFSVASCTGNGTGGESTSVAGTEHVCSSCHGPQGRSISPTFPNLAGQQKNYIAVELKSFRDHTRADPHAHTYMWGMAARLSDETIDGLAAFYSAQPAAEGSSEDPGDVATGRKIFETGVPERDVPPCMSCHGEKAQGAEAIPRLAGQHRSYLEGQLEAFASNAREDEIMHETSKNLTAREINQIAAYLASE
jgi:cytochrome c553